MVIGTWDGPKSTPTNPYLEADYLCVVPGTVFMVIVLLICAIKNHFCGIIQPVLDFAVAAFPRCWSPIATSTWWPRSSWITLYMCYLWGLKTISHSPLVIGFCLLGVLVWWASKGWMYLVTASLGHLLTKDCVP
jgi:hypothetical protein